MKIFVVGAQGRMGLAIQKIVRKRKNLVFAGGLARKSRGKIVSQLSMIKTKPDLVIDFSSPELFESALKWSQINKVAFLSGTTGFVRRPHLALQRAAKNIPVLWTANTSIGIQILKEILHHVPLPKEFRIQMTEWHHVHKKDRPSGTALVLQEILDQRRKGLPRPRAIREGEIVGTHRIVLSTKEEEISIEHKALDRAVFARGAVDVGVWLTKQKPGLYTMEDYLNS